MDRSERSSPSTGADESSASAEASGASSSAEASAGASSSVIIKNPIWAIEFGYEEKLPNIEKLFDKINTILFDGKITNCYVKYARKLYGAVGITPTGSKKPLGIRLSYPTLCLRPLSDTMDALLHETVHAFLEKLGQADPVTVGHGPNYHACVERIRQNSGICIKETLPFELEDINDDVKFFRCEGECRNWPPFFGIMRGYQQTPSHSPTHSTLCKGKLKKIQHCGILLPLPKVFFHESPYTTKNPASDEDITCFLCGEDNMTNAELRKHWNRCLKQFPPAEEENFLPDHMELDAGEHHFILPSEEKFACPLCLECMNEQDLLEHISEIEEKVE